MEDFIVDIAGEQVAGKDIEQDGSQHREKPARLLAGDVDDKVFHGNDDEFENVLDFRRNAGQAAGGDEAQHD